jgi:hypothetical protein
MLAALKFSERDAMTAVKPNPLLKILLCDPMVKSLIGSDMPCNIQNDQIRKGWRSECSVVQILGPESLALTRDPSGDPPNLSKIFVQPSSSRPFCSILGISV